MLSQQMTDALNEHLGAELFAAHMYLSMSAYAESIALPGAAGWIRLQSQEEYQHAMRFYQYVVDRGGRVRIGSLDEPPADFGRPIEMFERALEHERMVAERINKLYAMATDAGDYATQGFLHWFVNEQVEEEKTLMDIVDRLKLVGDDRSGLLLLDRELGARTTAE